jgi:acetoin utilization protein AcuA
VTIDPVKPTVQEAWFRTHGEEIRVLPYCTPDRIRNCSFHSGFGEYAKYRSIYTRKETLEEIASHQGANVTVALTPRDRIVGFGVLDWPGPEERWQSVGDGRIMMELEALEVCREMRGAGVASAILRTLLEDPVLEGRIVYLVGYSWTWDLEEAASTVHQYRARLVKLYTDFGFKEYQTNDFNICLKPENFFLARIGNRVSQELRLEFKWICFGQKP